MMRSVTYQAIGVNRTPIARVNHQFPGDGHADEGVTTGLGVHQGRERDQNDIGRVRRMVRKQPDDEDSGCEQRRRQPAYPAAEQGREQAGAFSHGGSQHHGQHKPEWRKPGQGLRHFDKQAGDVLAREQAD